MAADTGLPTTLKLEVATPKGLMLSIETTSVQAPSVNGEFGVLPGHLPVIAALRVGVMTYLENGESRLAAIDRGFVEAGADKVVLLTEAFARPEDVNVDEVRKDLAAAEALLVTLKEDTGSAAYGEALRDQAWAEARLLISGAPTAH